jgi:hypothetical protein
MSTTNGVRYEGHVVRMGDKDIVIPPLTFKQLKDDAVKANMQKMGTIGSRPEPEQLNAARDLIHACVERNYPGITAETMDEMITMGNLANCMRALFGMEVKALGEVLATQPEAQTGTSSTAT